MSECLNDRIDDRRQETGDGASTSSATEAQQPKLSNQSLATGSMTNDQ
jgi:hypothetical protein